MSGRPSSGPLYLGKEHELDISILERPNRRAGKDYALASVAVQYTHPPLSRLGLYLELHIPLDLLHGPRQQKHPVRGHGPSNTRPLMNIFGSSPPLTHHLSSAGARTLIRGKHKIIRLLDRARHCFGLCFSFRCGWALGESVSQRSEQA